jgi:hypothetical protein
MPSRGLKDQNINELLVELEKMQINFKLVLFYIELNKSFHL